MSPTPAGLARFEKIVREYYAHILKQKHINT